MTDCKGLFGKLFGHQFDKFMIKGPIDITAGDNSPITIENKETFMEMGARYEIRCKRCGCKADE